MVASPAAALVCDGSGSGETTLNWQHTGQVEIQLRNSANPDGKVFARGGATGSVSTGKWVRDGTVFDLYDLDSMELIQSVPVNATVLGCVSNAPGKSVGVAGAQHTNWLDRPTRWVCGSCHDDVNFETGEGHSGGNIAQPDDSKCGVCHVPGVGNEFDRSVSGAHLALYKSAQLPGVVVEFKEITNTNPGDAPVVTYSVISKNGSLIPADLNRLRFVITGPNEDYSFYALEDVRAGSVQNGSNWVYTFNTPLPMDAEGSFTLGLEGRAVVPVEMGSEVDDERDVAEPPSLAFAVTDASAMPRRMVVDDEKCESCHLNLSLHGGGRRDANYCISCHTPSLVDIATPSESVHMKWMIHKIHRGEDLQNGYIVVRNRGTYDFSHVEYPGDLRRCDACHVNNSQQIPLPDGVLPTITEQAWWDPTLPQAAACLSCHDDDESAVHAYSNTTFFGESCSTCHGEGKFASVDRVHAQ
jgi:OmcA/MtrC family decaheme c-type cytochrome